METTRRSLLFTGPALVGLSCATPALSAAPNSPPFRRTVAKPLRLLVLGGTRYLGPAVVRSALGRGHEVTLFNRGKTQSWLFPGLEKLNGNRFPEVGKGLSALHGREWDVIVDSSGQYPRVVDASTALLQHRSAHYIMVSSISAYSSFKAVGLDEGSPLRALGREYSENSDLVEGDWPTYGARKALGEATVAQRFEGRHTIVRPGPICGGDNNDGTGAYWAERLFRDTSVLVPGMGKDPLQLIDVRDAADFIVLAAEQRFQGAFNLVGPETAITVADYMAACRAAVGGRGEIVWAGDFPQELGNMPLIVPFHIAPGHATVRNTRAVAAGLRFRPLADTILSNWIDHRSRRGHLHDFGADGIGVPAARETELIAAQLDRG